MTKFIGQYSTLKYAEINLSFLANLMPDFPKKCYRTEKAYDSLCVW